MCQSARGQVPGTFSEATPALRACSGSALPDRARGGRGKETAVGWPAAGGGAHARKRFLVPCCLCARGWSARGGAARSRREGAPVGRGPQPGRAGRGRNDRVLRRAVGLAVDCAVRRLPRPVRDPRLCRGMGGRETEEGACAGKRLAGGEAEGKRTGRQGAQAAAGSSGGVGPEEARRS